MLVLCRIFLRLLSPLYDNNTFIIITATSPLQRHKWRVSPCRLRSVACNDIHETGARVAFAPLPGVASVSFSLRISSRLTSTRNINQRYLFSQHCAAACAGCGVPFITNAYSCMCHDVARPEGMYTHCTAALRSQRLIACFSYTRCLFAKSRFPSRLCACGDRDRAAAARDSFSLLQILYRLHLRELSRFSRFISTYSHTHIHKHTYLHSCKLHSAPHRHCNGQHDGLVAVLGPVH